MSKYYKMLDFFSQPPALRINGKKTLPTIFGATISIIAIICIITGLYFNLNDYFSYLTFKINSYTDNTNIPSIDLKRFKMGVLLLNGRAEEFADADRLFKISAAYWKLNLNPINPKPEIALKYDHIH